LSFYTGFQKGEDTKEGGFSAAISTDEGAEGRKVGEVDFLKGFEVFDPDGFNFHRCSD